VHLTRCLTLSILSWIFVSCVQGQPVSTSQPWSVRMAQSFMQRQPDSIFYSTEKHGARWGYEPGVMLEALRQLYTATGDQRYSAYIQREIDRYVTEDGDIRTYEYRTFNLDNIPTGRQLLWLSTKTDQEKYRRAAALLRKQLSEQPRTASGGFWHKQMYPNQMWLDGLYMAEPFYARYAVLFNEPGIFDDVVKQFTEIEAHTRDSATGLLYHAWDESKAQRWADPRTGRSPHLWGRAIGWYAIGLVDVLEVLPESHPGRRQLVAIFKRLAEAILRYRDSSSAVWYQVMDQPGREGNYLESSASCMFVYAFAKGARMGFLPSAYRKAAEESFAGILKQFVTVEEQSGLVSLHNTCQGAGLGGNPYRDGSFAYYVGEPRRSNDFKGVGPFILAALQLEQTGTPAGLGKTVGLDYFFNSEWREEKGGTRVRYHYTWNDTANSGYSLLGGVFEKLGATLATVQEAPTPERLDLLDVYIIVDPDTPAETAEPHMMDPASITAIVRWVEDGGVLVLLGNDRGNAEFAHWNRLAERFGIQFREDSHHRVVGKAYDTGMCSNLPDHPIFQGVRKIFLKEVSSLSVMPPATPLLVQDTLILMATSRLGKGMVFALGDPWIYNEYFDHRRLPADCDNDRAAEQFGRWLLSWKKGDTGEVERR
jgi:unsaturated rhamnogalacturonyl hydrolase